MSLRRHLDGEGIAHANADSKTHARHVRQRAGFRNIEWVPESVEENQAAVFRLNAAGLGMSKGIYFSGQGKTEKAVSGSEFESHCSAINWQRRWYVTTMTRGTRKATVRRKRTSPASEEHVVNFSPIQMRFINGELERWEKAGIPSEKRREMLLAILDEIRREIVEDFKNACHRDVVGSYLHFDSNKVHIGIIHSRIGPDNHLVGEKYLGTVGPWSVGQSRLTKLGLVDSGDFRLRENLERFHTRFGEDRSPLDLRLHDLLDQKFDTMVAGMGRGADRRFAEATDYYKAWKLKSRQEAFSRSPSAQQIAWQTIRLVQPLLPPQVRTAISVARNAVEVFRIIGLALDALAGSGDDGGGSSRSLSPQKSHIEKIL